MTTLREQYVGALLDLMTANPDLRQLNVQVGRSIVDALDEQHALALILHLGADAQPDRSAIGFATRQTEILCTVITRDSTPDQAADTVIEVAHPVIMNFDADALIATDEGQTDPPIFANVNGESCLRTVHYFFTYRTRSNSLTE